MAASVDAMVGGLRTLSRIAAARGIDAVSVGSDLPMLEASGLVRRAGGRIVLDDRLTGILQGLVDRKDRDPRA